MNTDDAVRSVLNEALRVYADSERATNWLQGHLERFEEPVRIAVVGPRESGKSTLVNALLGERVAPIGGDVFTWYRAGATPRATVHLGDGRSHELHVHRRGPGGTPAPGEPSGAPGHVLEPAPNLLPSDTPRVELGPWSPLQVDRIDVEWPTRALRDLTLVDAPADAPTARVCAEADGVLCLIRNRRAREPQLLQSAFEHPAAGPAPASTIAVLCRTDETGGGRVDALSAGRQLARRYRRDVELRSRCHDVVAVSGLVALAGRTLGEPEYAALAKLAAMPRSEQAELTLSADRLVQASAPVPPEVRRQLLDRLGIFGIRLGTTLIRTGFDDPARLSAELVQRSGLGELRDSIRRYFTERRGMLKARSALLAVEAVVRAEPRPSAGALVAEMERALAGAHDLAELQALAILQANGPKLLGELSGEAERIVGGHGTGVSERLGLEREPTDSELRHTIVDTLERWQEQAENPVRSAEARRAARVVVRTCEGMLAALYDGELSCR